MNRPAGQLLRGGAVVVSGQVAGQGLSFLRNVILARLLSKADFGVASVLGVALSVFELTTKLGLARIVVQDRDGDKPRFQASAQLFQACAGAVSAALLVLASPLLLRLFDLPPQHWWAFLALATIPLLRGLQHLDVRRFERELRFSPGAITDAFPLLLAVLLAWPVAFALRDYRAVVVLYVLQAVGGCVVSHFLAERSYSWSYDSQYLRRMARFGWPLLCNGFLIFAIWQGDQVLVASTYTLEELAPYAAAAVLAMAPSILLANAISSVFLPVLAEVQHMPSQFSARYRRTVAIATVLGVPVASGMLAGGEGIMRLVYGAKYSGSGVVLSWLVAVVAFRTIRIAPALAALAKGDSQNQLWSNVARAASLVPALILSSHRAPLWTIAACGLVGEILAAGVSVIRLQRRDGTAPAVTIVPMLVAAFCLSLSGAVATCLGAAGARTALHLLAMFSSSLLGFALAVVLLPEVRGGAAQLISAYRQGGWTAALAKMGDRT